jgi:hypothetical protein
MPSLFATKSVRAKSVRDQVCSPNKTAHYLSLFANQVPRPSHDFRTTVKSAAWRVIRLKS